MQFHGFKLAYQNGKIDHFMTNPDTKDAMNQAIIQNLDKTIDEFKMQELCKTVP